MVNVDSSYPKILRVGIIGLGEIAQVAHIPILQNLRHLYEITAICDVSKKALAYCSSRFHIKQTFTSATDLIACSDVDVVFVLNSDEFHATFAIEAINAGKHVLIEKPMALTLSECDAIIAASKAHAESIVFVAYMRRYASAFEQACEMVKSFETILHARVRSVIGPNSVFVDQGGMYPQRFADFPESATAERNAALGKVAVEVLGANAADQGLNIWWRILNGLSSHDLSAMREMLGVPKRVLAAHTARQGMFLNAIFDYGNFNCQLETGIDALARFDAFIEVTGPTRSVKIAFDTPYIKVSLYPTYLCPQRN